MLAHFQVLEIGGFTGPSAVDCIFPCIQHALPWQRNIFFSSVLFLVLSDVITSLSGELNATLKKYQDWDLLNQMQSQVNIKNRLLTIFQNASPVCLHAPFLICYLRSYWCFQRHRKWLYEESGPSQKVAVSRFDCLVSKFRCPYHKRGHV